MAKKRLLLKVPNEAKVVATFTVILQAIVVVLVHTFVKAALPAPVDWRAAWLLMALLGQILAMFFSLSSFSLLWAFEDERKENRK